ncbi:glycoside hydrolase [Mucilaginibacter arboris]|uniref:O-Glycosyl hydrolase n=1 Tax=Mucilaginibacter arboris TaxID=2682090 RepID=A0A7K1STC1_9SPHI|nr:hypothetical protein [Mucilaginibacter arboris]MVN20504.1 hypothetical protein [Mucilaginibacter arboris]
MNSSIKTFCNPLLQQKTFLLFLLFSGFFIQKTHAQTEVMPWGNITGIRVDGQLMEFESRLSVVGKDGIKTASTGKERQRPKYTREGNTQIVATKIDSLYFTEKVEDLSRGKTSVDIQLTANADTALTGTYFALMLPAGYANGSVQVNGSAAIPLSTLVKGDQSQANTSAKTIRLVSAKQQLLLTLDGNASFIIKKNAKSGNYEVYLPIQTGAVQKGQNFHKTFSIEASGEVDKLPIALSLNTAKQGREFAGFGGNFRIQNPKLDPQVIDYSLQNLRVAWGRVEMPWRFWQPEKNVDPTTAAQGGKLDVHVQQAMEMAQRLGKMNIPVILTAWAPPAWAIVGKPNFRPVNGIWGNPLDKTQTPEIYKSITDYILYLKQHYGVEVADFSFNESDLGINIRQTGEEHAELIKGLGAYFASKGLKTKLLLGDNSDATSYAFIYPAMKDPATKPYIGAVSFHSWRGWETEILQKWADAAAELNLPLIVGEGSTDAAAYNYPAVFAEPTYALQEINLYVRLLAICQPLTILQWQLTADYSPLAGGGIFGDNGPLRPTQRFWNLKQLSSTPKNVYAMPITANRPNVSCAALGNNATGVYSIHLVNNGTTRQVILTGLAEKVKALKMFVTDQKRAMNQEKSIAVTNGKAIFNLGSQTYTTLVTD